MRKTTSYGQKRLEKAGCHVIYGLRGLKTHSKITLVVRREDDGIRYVHLGTGNYNDSTAKLYTDCGIMTCGSQDRRGCDGGVQYAFGIFRSRTIGMSWCWPPIWLRKWLIKKINRETEFARKGMPAAIIAKMNSLCDKGGHRCPHEASAAGVKIDAHSKRHMLPQGGSVPLDFPENSKRPFHSGTLP